MIRDENETLAVSFPHETYEQYRAYGPFGTDDDLGDLLPFLKTGPSARSRPMAARRSRRMSSGVWAEMN